MTTLTDLPHDMLREIAARLGTGEEGRRVLASVCRTLYAALPVADGCLDWPAFARDAGPELERWLWPTILWQKWNRRGVVTEEARILVLCGCISLLYWVLAVMLWAMGLPFGTTVYTHSYTIVTHLPSGCLWILGLFLSASRSVTIINVILCVTLVSTLLDALAFGRLSYLMSNTVNPLQQAGATVGMLFLALIVIGDGQLLLSCIQLLMHVFVPPARPPAGPIKNKHT